MSEASSAYRRAGVDSDRKYAAVSGATAAIRSTDVDFRLEDTPPAQLQERGEETLWLGEIVAGESRVEVA